MQDNANLICSGNAMNKVLLSVVYAIKLTSKMQRDLASLVQSRHSYTVTVLMLSVPLVNTPRDTVTSGVTILSNTIS